MMLLVAIVMGAKADSYVGKNTGTAGTIIYYNNNTSGSNKTITNGADDNGLYPVSGTTSMKKAAEMSVTSDGIAMFCVDNITTGTVTITLAGSTNTPDFTSTANGSDGRYFQLYVGDNASKKYLYSKYADNAVTKEGDDSGLTYVGDKIRGLHSFDFTSSDLTTVGEKKYLKFKAMGGEMKPYGVKIVSSAPTLPTITTQPQGASYVSGDPISALTVVATASAGTLTYQWYKNTTNTATVDADHAIEGAQSASYTPSEAGYYYVVVTDGNGSVTSSVAQITISAAEAPTIEVTGAPTGDVKVGTEVILTATATGTPTPTITWYDGNDESVATVEGTELPYIVPTNTAGTYTFYAKASNGVGDDATSAVQTVVVKEQVATPTFTPNGAFFEGSQEVAIASATDGATIQYSTDNGESWNNYTAAFTVTATTTVKAKATKDGYIDSEEATATFTLVDLEPQADVTGAVTWDWNTVTNSSAVELDKSPNVLNGVDVTFANISAYGYTAVAGLAAQDALLMNGQRAYNNANGSKHCQVNYLKFNTTVAGKVTVEYANTGGNAARTVNVNGTKGTKSSTANNSYQSEEFYVEVGAVEIKGVQVSDDADKMLRIRKVVFTPFAAQNITVGETGFATVGLPFATTVPAGVTAYAVESVTGSKVKMSPAIAAGTTIPANKGFVIVAAKGTYSFTEVATAEYEGTDILEAVGATPKAATPEAPIYVLAVTGEKKVGFKKATSGELGAYKAYLPGTVSTLTSLSASFDDDPTAVDAIAEANEADAEAPVKVIKNGKLFIGNYNVAGQQVK